MCAHYNFNQFLDMVMQKMIKANSNNQVFARIWVQDETSFSCDVVKEVKTFLMSQDFVITEVEDSSGNTAGWKLSW
jgi:hypothetical protein